MRSDVIWILLGLFAIVLAVNAGFRVRRKRLTRLETNTLLTSVQSGRTVTPSTSLQDVEPDRASATVTAPDRQAEQVEISQSEISVPSSEQPTTAPSQSPSSESTSQDEIPLATSLTVSELVQSDAVSSATAPAIDLNLSHPTSDSALQEPHHQQDVLTEIAELENSSQPTNRSEQLTALLQQVENPDPIVRSALAATLGELASQQGQNMEEIVTHLTKLAADSNLQVRTEAAAALGRLGIIAE